MTKNMTDQNQKTKMSDSKDRQDIATPGDATDRDVSAPEQRGRDAGGRNDR